MMKLLPRPFCGGKNIEELYCAGCMRCDDCLAMGPLCGDNSNLATVIEAWNRRAAPTVSQARIKELEAALDDLLDATVLLANTGPLNITAKGWDSVPEALVKAHAALSKESSQ